MDNGIYAALTGYLAQARRLDLMSNNLANANTAGFKDEKLFFNGIVMLGIDKLRTQDQNPNKSKCLEKGFDIFNKSIQDTPHYKLVKEFCESPDFNIEDSEYCKLVDFVLSISKKPYIHNEREIIESGLKRAKDYLDLYKRMKLDKKVEPIKVKALFNGDYIITDGLHRVAIALVMGHETVPVEIIEVDDQINAMLERLMTEYPVGRRLYIPIEHPKFSNWKLLRDDTRWKLMSSAFDWKGKKVLDIGCYTGYFSHKIAKKGGIVIGVETDVTKLRVAKEENSLLKLDVEFILGSFDTYIKGKQFDCVIFFSVLHWILKDKGIEGVKESLTLISVSSPVMFFDMGQNNEEKMRTEEWNHGMTIDKDTIPGLIIGNSGYTDFKHLGTSDSGRDVFKFWRR